MRVNWLAIVVADIVLFLFGYVWYGLLFKAMWMTEIAKINPQYGGAMNGAGIYPYVVSLVAGFFSAYGLARMLVWRNDWTVGRAAFIGFSMGLLLFGTMTYMDYVYSGFGMTLGWIHVGFVAVGFSIQGVVLALIKPKPA
jgi:hypothetical protein